MNCLSNHLRRGLWLSLAILPVLAVLARADNASGWTLTPEANMSGLEGHEWSEPSTTPFGNRLRVAVGDGANVYAIGRPPGQTTLATRRSTDHGETWDSSVDVTGDTGIQLYRSLVARGSNLHLITARGNGSIPVWAVGRNLHYRHSPDGGLTWRAAVELEDEKDWIPGRVAMWADSQNDTTHIISGHNIDGVANRIWYFGSTDGTSFIDKVLAEAFAPAPGVGNPSIASWGDLVVATWSTGIGGAGEPIWISRSTDGGANWSTPSELYPGLHNRPRVHVHGSTVVVLTETDGGGKVTARRSLDGGVSWLDTQEISAGSHGAFRWAEDGMLHVMTHDSGLPGHWYAYSTDDGETWSDPQQASDIGANVTVWEIDASREWVHASIGTSGDGVSTAYIRRIVPEPAAVGLLAPAAALLFRRRRRNHSESPAQRREGLSQTDGGSGRCTPT